MPVPVLSNVVVLLQTFIHVDLWYIIQRLSLNPTPNTPFYCDDFIFLACFLSTGHLNVIPLRHQMLHRWPFTLLQHPTPGQSRRGDDEQVAPPNNAYHALIHTPAKYHASQCRAQCSAETAEHVSYTVHSSQSQWRWCRICEQYHAAWDAECTGCNLQEEYKGNADALKYRVRLWHQTEIGSEDVGEWEHG